MLPCPTASVASADESAPPAAMAANAPLNSRLFMSVVPLPDYSPTTTRLPQLCYIQSLVSKILLVSLGVCCLDQAQTPAASAWKFAVSGDSRNCGDVVMPAIAKGVQQNSAEFYWHLGDFRAIYAFDEDMAPPPQLGLPPKPLSVSTYLISAWPDFIARQMSPFGATPVFLGI